MSHINPTHAVWNPRHQSPSKAKCCGTAWVGLLYVDVGSAAVVLKPPLSDAAGRVSQWFCVLSQAVEGSASGRNWLYPQVLHLHSLSFLPYLHCGWDGRINQYGLLLPVLDHQCGHPRLTKRLPALNLTWTLVPVGVVVLWGGFRLCITPGEGL